MHHLVYHQTRHAFACSAPSSRTSPFQPRHSISSSATRIMITIITIMVAFQITTQAAPVAPSFASSTQCTSYQLPCGNQCCRQGLDCCLGGHVTVDIFNPNATCAIGGPTCIYSHGSCFPGNATIQLAVCTQLILKRISLILFYYKNFLILISDYRVNNLFVVSYFIH